MHPLTAAVALGGAAGFLVSTWRRRLPLSLAPVVALWGLAAVLWPAVDESARTHLMDVADWLLTVTLCALAVTHTSRTRTQQSTPSFGRPRGWRQQ